MSRTAGPNPLRHVNARVLALRAVFRTLGPVAPDAAARLAETIFCTPPRHEVREREERFLETGTAFQVPWRRERETMALAGWRWGSGPLVVLVHGWGSRAGRFSRFVPELVKAGFSAIAYDNPAHGRTGGRLASLPEFADALTAMVQANGPVAAYVGHSLGASALMLAQGRGLQSALSVLISAPADPEIFSRRFARHLAMPDRVRERMEQKLRHRLRIEWRDLYTPGHAATFPHPLLIVHDEGDADVPFADGETIAQAAPRATLVRTTGLGHRAIMRDPEVVRRVVAFIRDQRH